MKKLGILLIVLFTANSGPMFSQKNELNYKNKIYVYDTKNMCIYNKENRIKGQKPCQFSVETDLSFPYILKGILSEQQLQELRAKKSRLPVILYCNERGEILELKFILTRVSLEDITLPIISSIEKTLQGSQFKLRNICPNVKYYMLTKVIKFDEIYN